MWVIGAVAVILAFIVLTLLSLKNASGKQKLALIFVSLGYIIFLADVAAVCFGWWKTGFASKIFFLIGFIASAVVFLRIVPENIKAAEKAEKLQKQVEKLHAEGGHK